MGQAAAACPSKTGRPERVRRRNAVAVRSVVRRRRRRRFDDIIRLVQYGNLIGSCHGDGHLPEAANRSTAAARRVPQTSYVTLDYTTEQLSLHCALSLAAQCCGGQAGRQAVFVGGSVTMITRNCVHRSSPNWVCR